MKLHVISSSSEGNCYLLEGSRTALIIECGQAPQKMVTMTGIDFGKIVGAVVTHEHGDHAAYIDKFALRGIPIIASAGTLEKCGLLRHRQACPIRATQSLAIGDFIVRAFGVQHDAAEPLGFIIEHPEAGKILFVTDTGRIPYNFKAYRLNHLLIEANFSDDVMLRNIEQGRTATVQYERVIRTHLSIEACCATIAECATPALATVVLIHLSDGNSHARRFAAQAQKTAPFTRVHVADEGLTIELNKDEF
ncbi:MBL fold metallo-hydrolase [uncultured Alistipes sp.]|jgi:metal-dependent hydrolases of the beta-lactamase superfamily I|uniref:MBL fold metallo-hydrolase n=1 Tax=uncultured Alistipes sp. TaxID=538949 RepID=UPI0025D87FD3|nr:MBL fold metallo-hydrolase [uncultured Alistipes sp.]